eukprot:2125980-Amphidinium_carterae.2
MSGDHLPVLSGSLTATPPRVRFDKVGLPAYQQHILDQLPALDLWQQLDGRESYKLLARIILDAARKAFKYTVSQRKSRSYWSDACRQSASRCKELHDAVIKSSPEPNAQLCQDLRAARAHLAEVIQGERQSSWRSFATGLTVRGEGAKKVFGVARNMAGRRKITHFPALQKPNGQLLY